MTNSVALGRPSSIIFRKVFIIKVVARSSAKETVLKLGYSRIHANR